MKTAILQRPLIPILIAFAGGILVAHQFLSSCQWLILPVLFCIAVFLFASISFPRRWGIFLLLFAFFLTGALLDMLQHRPSKLLSRALNHKKTTLEGTILEPAKITNEMAKFRIHAHVLLKDGQTMALDEKILVTIYNHIPDLRPGQKILFPARLR